MTETRLRAHAYGPDVIPDDPHIVINRQVRVEGGWIFYDHITQLPWTLDEHGLVDGPDYVLLKQGFRRPEDCEWQAVDYSYGDNLTATIVELPSNPLPLED